jgi:dolichol kinase
MAKSFPLLGLCLLLFVGLHYTTDLARPWYQSEVQRILLPSGDDWRISGSDLFLMSSLSLLFFELVRSTRSDRRSLMNHSLDVLVFIAALVLFLTQAGYGNSTFFGLLAMTLVDFVAGFIISATAARRDATIERVPHHSSS